MYSLFLYLCFALQIEATLTIANLTSALEEVVDWDDLVRSLDVPFQIRTEIEEKYSSVTQRKQAMLEEWRNTTPAPSWMAIANALYRVYIDGDYGKYHKVFQLVKEKYLKSKENSVFLHAHTLTVPLKYALW